MLNDGCIVCGSLKLQRTEIPVERTANYSQLQFYCSNCGTTFTREYRKESAVASEGEFFGGKYAINRKTN